jgi:cell division protein FtsQ
LKKGKEILLWGAIGLYMIVVLGMVDDRLDEIPCQSILVNILDSTDNKFVSSHDIYTRIISSNDKILGNPLSLVDVKNIENETAKYPFIRSAEVFTSSNGNLNVNIYQREPVVRVLNYKDEGYYIDKHGFIMPVNEFYTARVVIANGWNLGDMKTGVGLEEEHDSKNYKIVEGVYKLANYIYHNDFWKAQIEQIYVTRNGEYELIPRVGSHLIKFGDSKNHQDKFDNLFALYEQGLNKEGWNKYTVINLKYKDQVICTKR